MEDDKRNVIVIGAGLSGLAAASVIARRGRPVVLLEAGPRPGGACSTDTVDGHAFNNGAIYLAVPSLLRHALRRMGIDPDAVLKLHRIAHPIEVHAQGGVTVHLAQPDACRVEGPGEAALTGRLKDGLAALQHEWRPVYRTLVDRILPREPSMLGMLAALLPHLGKLSGRVDKLVARHFRDASLRDAVASTLLYTGRAPASLPASQIVGLLALLEEGFHMPAGGMGAIAGLLRERLPPQVALRLDAPVREIEIQPGRGACVVLDSGERIAAARVVSTISHFDTLRRLKTPGGAPRALARIARKAPLSHRAVAIQLGCSGAALPASFMVQHVPEMARQGDMHRFNRAGIAGFAYAIPSNVLPSCAPPGKAVIEMYAPVSDIRSAAEWTPAMTASAVEQHVAALTRSLPGLRIETQRVLDPNDFAARRHLYEGALYGIAPGVTPNLYFPHRSGIPELYLAGQTTYPGYGVPTAMLSGIMAAEALVEDMEP